MAEDCAPATTQGRINRICKPFKSNKAPAAAQGRIAEVFSMFPYVVINRPAAFIYSEPVKMKPDGYGRCISAVSDEGLYGNVCRVLKEEQDFLYIISSYGYAGFVHREDVLPLEESQLREWMEGVMVVDGLSTDILTAPVLHGSCIMTLPRGALIKPAGPSEEGYTRVCLADGNTGYIASNRLTQKRFGEELLEEDPDVLIELQKNAVSERKKAAGGKTGFDFRKILDRWYGETGSPAAGEPAGSILTYAAKEEAFRKKLISTAAGYLGVQYRWGGRSSFGIDCSGLTHLSYLLCGVHIFRDAAIVKEYPLRRLELKWTDNQFDLSNLDSNVLRAGDLIYFPGHVAMYLGDGLYIHSTGKAGDMGVVLNSLRPEHGLFRKDLLEKMYAAAGIRLQEG